MLHMHVLYNIQQGEKAVTEKFGGGLRAELKSLTRYGDCYCRQNLCVTYYNS